MPLNTPISILIADSTSLDRNAMADAIRQYSQIKAVTVAASLEEVFQKIPIFKPDILILEYEMPNFQPEKSIPRLKTISPTAEIVLVSRFHRTTSEESLKALELGAMYFLKKPKENDLEITTIYYEKFFRPVINLYTISRNTKEIHRTTALTRSAVFVDNTPPAKPLRSNVRGDFVLLAVGASLGGPEALKRFIPLLPADFPLPIVVTQHMPEGFTATLAGAINEKSQLVMQEAHSGEIIKPGRVYLAPGGKHMLIRKDALGKSSSYAIMLDSGPPVHGCRPSVDVMFNSIAENVPGNILTVVLTGMGEDGRDGVRKMKEAGRCYCITQDEATCVVYGMPAAVVKAGLSDMALSIHNIPIRVNEMARARSNSTGKIPIQQ